MPRKRESQSIPAGFTPGDEMLLDSVDYRSLAINLSGEAVFYVGYRAEDQPHDIPYYAFRLLVERRRDVNLIDLCVLLAER